KASMNEVKALPRHPFEIRIRGDLNPSHPATQLSCSFLCSFFPCRVIHLFLGRHWHHTSRCKQRLTRTQPKSSRELVPTLVPVQRTLCWQFSRRSHSQPCGGATRTNFLIKNVSLTSRVYIDLPEASTYSFGQTTSLPMMSLKPNNAPRHRFHKIPTQPYLRFSIPQLVGQSMANFACSVHTHHWHPQPVST